MLRHSRRHTAGRCLPVSANRIIPLFSSHIGSLSFHAGSRLQLLHVTGWRGMNVSRVELPRTSIQCACDSEPCRILRMRPRPEVGETSEAEV